jgi:hypothetical protein
MATNRPPYKHDPIESVIYTLSVFSNKNDRLFFLIDTVAMGKIL